jgi:hypothetical protein
MERKEQHMEIHSDQSSIDEHTVISIIRRLPPDKIAHLVDFAKFLEFEYVRKNNGIVDKDNTDTEEAEEKWDKLFAETESKRVMRDMAREARKDYYEGKTTDISVTEDGRLTPA